MPILEKLRNIFAGGGEGKKKVRHYQYIKRGVDPSESWDIVGELGDGAFGKVYKVFLTCVSSLDTGQLSDRYRIATNTGCIVSNHVSFCCIGENPILHASMHIADSAAVNRSHYTGDQRTYAPRHPQRMCHLIHDMGEGLRGGRRETVTWYQPPHDTKMALYWVLATSNTWCRTPSTSRKW